MTTEVIASQKDVKVEMRTMVEDRVVIDHPRPVRELARSYYNETVTKYTKLGQAIVALDVGQLENMIYRTRTKEFGDVDESVNRHPACSIAPESNRLFLQFNLTVNVDGQLRRIICHAHPGQYVTVN